MATLDLTVNSRSSSPDPLETRGNDTINFIAGTDAPADVYFATGDLFGSRTIRVGTSQVVSGSVAQIEYPFFDEEQSIDDPRVHGTQIGTIKVG